ncbi:MAG: hypothetical protein HY820_10295 [Acidobacteria bacterium]|nr:hypothetical protein [Acidobacteriota bacterium]
MSNNLIIVAWTMVIFTGSANADQAARQKMAAEAPARGSAPRAAVSGESRSAASNIVNETIGQNFSVDAGKSARITAKADFSGAERASFGVYADPSANITKLRIAIWWGNAETSAYAVHAFITASGFFYTNTGAGQVAVGGPNLIVDVINEGDTPVTIQQLTVYAVVR